MNRELKFRAWSTKHKKFLTIGFHIIGETTFFDMLNQHRLEELDTINITQFTGVKDRKGVEIYEGDILSHGPTYKPYVVEYNDRIGAFTASGFPFNLNEGRCVSTHSLEIIGNIFENQDLLKK